MIKTGKSLSWRNNLNLWWQLTRRDIAARHKGSYLGFFWVLLTPLLEFAIYATVFGFIFGGHYGMRAHETAADYALGVFLSLTCFRFVAEIVATAPGIVVNQPNFVKKVVFPLILLPLTAVGSMIYRIGVSLLLFLVGFVFMGPGASIYNLWLPVLLAALGLHAIGLAWLLSALGVFLRDISQVTGVFNLILLYSSAIFYSVHTLEGKSTLAWSILRFNPLLQIVENARRIMIWQLPPSPAALVYVFFTGLLLLAAGYFCFRRLRPMFADVL